MRLVIALLVLAAYPIAAFAPQNVPTRRSEQDGGRDERGDVNLRELARADAHLDLALEALGRDRAAAVSDRLSATLSAKAELLAASLIELCLRVTCTDDDGANDE